MLEVLVFDLDDTLYPEKDFVMSGYRAVAEYLADLRVCDDESAFRCMVEAYVRHGKQSVFPELIERFPGISTTLGDLVDIYRGHNPDIRLFPEYLSLLQELGLHYRLGIITDGLPPVQERKVHALGLEGIVHKIIYTWAYGADKEKPHPFSFLLMLESLRGRPDSALFVGDNLDKDCRGAHQVGMKCVQVLHSVERNTEPCFSVQERPEFTINSLLQLPQILRQMN